MYMHICESGQRIFFLANDHTNIYSEKVIKYAFHLQKKKKKKKKNKLKQAEKRKYCRPFCTCQFYRNAIIKSVRFVYFHSYDQIASCNYRKKI